MNINKITLMGRLTADPELKISQSNVPILKFTVAVNRKGENKGADFIDCVCFYQTAEFVSKHFKKASVIIVFGSLQIYAWKDKKGNNQHSPRVMIDEVMFGESKSKTLSNTIDTTAGINNENAKERLDLLLSDYEDELPF